MCFSPSNENDLKEKQKSASASKSLIGASQCFLSLRVAFSTLPPSPLHVYFNDDKILMGFKPFASPHKKYTRGDFQECLPPLSLSVAQVLHGAGTRSLRGLIKGRAQRGSGL
ncbi:hypothetical protein ATANTOWER_010190 [Ataeniobius toweri]|uniref:Uncharacterized protein n=1 Tax=Ataeniobius toweri TaxID=208326 RepID=A0ABU7ATI2_9TELE|nr:hypothetical protein [Ataeniobius toweri]